MDANERAFICAIVTAFLGLPVVVFNSFGMTSAAVVFLAIQLLMLAATLVNIYQMIWGDE